MATTVPAARRRTALNALFLTTDTHKYALFTTAYTPGQTTYAVTNEASGTGYTAGGVTVTGATNATGTSKAYADIADPAWTGLTATFQWGVLYSTTDGNKVILEQDLGSQSVTATDVTITQPAAAEATAMLKL